LKKVYKKINGQLVRDKSHSHAGHPWRYGLVVVATTVAAVVIIVISLSIAIVGAVAVVVVGAAAVVVVGAAAIVVVGAATVVVVGAATVVVVGAAAVVVGTIALIGATRNMPVSLLAIVVLVLTITVCFTRKVATVSKAVIALDFLDGALGTLARSRWAFRAFANRISVFNIDSVGDDFGDCGHGRLADHTAFSDKGFEVADFGQQHIEVARRRRGHFLSLNGLDGAAGTEEEKETGYQKGS
jgi:hypothetical protein